MQPCVSLFGRIFGHRYRGRYSEWESTPFWTGAATVNFSGVHTRALEPHVRRRTYQGDICERCGHIREALPEEPRAAAATTNIPTEPGYPDAF